jgi:hypothetical protein
VTFLTTTDRWRFIFRLWKNFPELIEDPITIPNSTLEELLNCLEFADLDGILPTINLIRQNLIHIEKLETDLPDFQRKRDRLKEQIDEMERTLRKAEDEDHGQGELKKAMTRKSKHRSRLAENSAELRVIGQGLGNLIVKENTLPEIFRKLEEFGKYTGMLREVITFVQQQPVLYSSVRKEGYEMLSEFERSIEMMKSLAIQIVTNEEDWEDCKRNPISGRSVINWVS